MGVLGIQNNLTAKQTAEHRLRIARGQLETVLKKLENDEYCVDIIHQTKSIQNALREVNYILLENHLRTCVQRLIKSGEGEHSIDEIMRIFKSGS